MKNQDLIQNEEVYGFLSELLRFNSVLDTSKAHLGHPYSEGATQCLEFFLARARADGFQTVNFDNKVGYIQWGDHHDYIGVLCHLDVVPAGNYWTEDPFGGRITEDRIIGRGALDDKGPAAASYFALKALKDANVVLGKSVRLILGLNEETGSACVKHYRTKSHDPIMGFTPDADFPVIYAEKGITSFKLVGEFDRTEIAEATTVPLQVISISGGTAVNMVPDTCEATLAIVNEGAALAALEEAKATFLQATEGMGISLDIKTQGHVVTVTLRGVSAHASTPEVGKNAISYLMWFLNELPLGICNISRAIRKYGTYMGTEYHGESIGMGLSDQQSGKLTLNVGKINLDQDGLVLHINVRFPVTANTDMVYNSDFEAIIKKANLTYTVDHSVAPIVHDQEGYLVKTLMDVYRTQTGDHEAQPICIGGGTYARSMPGIVAFGPLFPHTHDTMHQADEYLTKSDLDAMVAIYTDAIERLAR